MNKKASILFTLGVAALLKQASETPEENPFPNLKKDEKDEEDEDEEKEE